MENSLKELLVAGAAKLGVPLENDEVAYFEQYLDFLLEYNQKINLTAIRDHRDVIIKHFLDSIAVIPHLPKEEWIKLLDVGTGAGFPGIPIKILLPKADVVLLDSVKKKVDFLNALIKELSLIQTTAFSCRAEELAHDLKYRENFNVVVSRAVAELVSLSELCLPFLLPGGLFIAYKGLKAYEEIEEAGAALKVLGGRLLKTLDVSIPELDEKRVLIFIEKVDSTPEKFPRRVGMPEKKPLRKGGL